MPSSRASSSVNSVSMGTTILAVRYKDGVIVAADTRTSVSGYVSNRFASKVTFILEPPIENMGDAHSLNHTAASTCCVCRSGSAADTQYLAEQTRDDLLARQILQNGNPPTVTNAAHLLKNCVYNNPQLSCSLICAGYDHILERGVIYSISPGGSFLEEPLFAVGGSGSTYILGHLDLNSPNDFISKEDDMKYMDENEAVNFVEQAVQMAMSRDGSSGGFVRMFVIDKNGKRCVDMKQDRRQKKYFISSSKKSGGVTLKNFADVSPVQ